MAKDKKMAERLKKSGAYRGRDIQKPKQEWLDIDSLALTDAIGLGYPKGRMVEIYGGESSGKSTLACYIISQYQKAGFECAYVDAEQTFDFEHAEELGVDTDALWMTKEKITEEVFGLMEAWMVIEDNIKLIIVDSIAALTSQQEEDGDMGDANMGKQAKIMSQGCRKITKLSADKGCSILFINQTRASLDRFNPKDVTTGGRAIKFATTTRLQTREVSKIYTKEDEKEKSRPIGFISEIKVIKNKAGSPGRKVRMNFNYETGFDGSRELVKYSCDHGLIKQAGAWYSYADKKMNGIENVYKFLDSNPKIAKELKDECMKAVVDGNRPSVKKAEKEEKENEI